MSFVAWSNARMVWDRDTGIVGSKPSWGLDIRLLCCVIMCVCRGLAEGHSLFWGVLPKCLKVFIVPEVNSDSEEARGPNSWNVQQQQQRQTQPVTTILRYAMALWVQKKVLTFWSPFSNFLTSDSGCCFSVVRLVNFHQNQLRSYLQALGFTLYLLTFRIIYTIKMKEEMIDTNRNTCTSLEERISLRSYGRPVASFCCTKMCQDTTYWFGLFWTGQWTFCFHKRQWISWLAQWLLASEGFYFRNFI